jgi:hypothetical protein
MSEHGLRRRQSRTSLTPVAGGRFGGGERGLRQLQIGLPDNAPDTSLSLSSGTTPDAKDSINGGNHDHP